MKKIKNERGVALIIGLMLIVVLIPLTAIIVQRTIHEYLQVQKDSDRARAFYIAEAGAHAGLDSLDSLINGDMMTTINAMIPSAVISVAQSNLDDGIQFLIDTVKDGGTSQLTQNDAQAEFTVNATNFGEGQYQYNIVLTSQTDPVVVASDTWDFPYTYRIESTGSFSGLTQKVLLSGDFTVRVQRDSFARYALFTNQQTLPNGTTNVWFTGNTNFAGPIHTNGRYNIYGNPSGVFEGNVAQQEQLARYYNNGISILLDADLNGSIDVPTFHAGFDRAVSGVSLSSSIQKQDLVDQSKGGQGFAGNGIFIANNGTSLEGGVYVNGDSSIDLSVDVNDNAVYTINQGATTKIITVDQPGNQTTVEVVGGGTTAYQGIPDGIDDVGTVIFVDGNITGLSGVIQEDTALTISSENDIVISDHIQYSDYTPAIGAPGDVNYVPPNAVGVDNLLGLVAWNGDVRIGTTAPDDVNIHGTILAQNGVFQVDQYNNQGVGPRGTATLLGGVITDYYGAFGLFNGSTGLFLSGYGRNFIYDTRMQGGTTPPYFPSLNAFIAFTNDISDKIIWQDGGA